MTIELPGTIEEQLRTLAAKQGRDVHVLVEDAIRQYLEATAITDVEPGELTDTQNALLDELPRVPDWKAGGA